MSNVEDKINHCREMSGKHGDVISIEVLQSDINDIRNLIQKMRGVDEIVGQLEETQQLRQRLLLRRGNSITRKKSLNAN